MPKMHSSLQSSPRRVIRTIRSPTRIIAGTLSFIAILYTLSNHIPSTSSSSTERAGNSTLGFEKILVLGLPERTDRRDAIALCASLTSLSITFIDGIHGSTIPDKALPPGRDRSIDGGNASIGSWRGHINAIRHIIDNKLSSALIMEDDVDWDIRLHSQMIDFARGVRAVTLSGNGNEGVNSPYGDNWDVLWPGHCGEVLPETPSGQPDPNTKIHIQYNDETVPPKEHQPWLKALSTYPEHTRIIHTTGAPLCTFAYAISFSGAQKILASLALHGSNLKFDNELAYFCRDKVLGARCVSVQPMLFYHHKGVGVGAKDSDIQVWGDGGQVREKGFTDNIVRSTRLNVERLVEGREDWVLQW